MTDFTVYAINTEISFSSTVLVRVYINTFLQDP